MSGDDDDVSVVASSAMSGDDDDVFVVASSATSALPSAYFFTRKRKRQLGKGKVPTFEIVQELSTQFFEANPTIIEGNKTSPNHVCTLCWELMKVQPRRRSDHSKGFVNNIAKEHIMNKHPETPAGKQLSKLEASSHDTKVSALGIFGVNNALK